MTKKGFTQYWIYTYTLWRYLFCGSGLFNKAACWGFVCPFNRTAIIFFNSHDWFGGTASRISALLRQKLTDVCDQPPAANQWQVPQLFLCNCTSEQWHATKGKWDAPINLSLIYKGYCWPWLTTNTREYPPQRTADSLTCMAKSDCVNETLLKIKSLFVLC